MRALGAGEAVVQDGDVKPRIPELTWTVIRPGGGWLGLSDAEIPFVQVPVLWSSA